MKQSFEYRQEARATLSGNWAVAALFYFVFTLIIMALNSAFTLPFGTNEVSSGAGSIIGTIVCGPLEWGAGVAFLILLRSRQLELEMLFRGYPQIKVWTTMLLKYVYIMLWTLLLIIPGIIKLYSYSMTEYLMLDDENLKDNAAIEESMRLMQGRKWDLFCLDLSFIGWILLSLLTFGIGFFWLAPYMETAHAAFYEEAKRDYYGASE